MRPLEALTARLSSGRMMPLLPAQRAVRDRLLAHDWGVPIAAVHERELAARCVCRNGALVEPLHHRCVQRRGAGFAVRREVWHGV